MAEEKFTGGCLCGAVRYEATGPLRDVSVCHCGQCRKWHGHAGAYTAVDRPRLKLPEQRGLRWFRSSEFARRGFCSECGSSLFWQHDKAGHTSIAAGTLDGPTGIATTKHIYAAHKGDYYEIADSLPKLAEH